MNKVILSGNLCQEIELKQTQNGKSVVTNCVAVQREYKNEQGSYDSDFINLVLWGNQAEYLSRYANKGDRVELVGRWNVRKFPAKDGTTRTVNECIVESVKAFSKQKTDESKPQFTENNPQFEELGADDDLPF